jgi:hypothetical protein
MKAGSEMALPFLFQNCKDLLSIYTREWFLNSQDVQWIYDPARYGGFFILLMVGIMVGLIYIISKKGSSQYS